MKFEVFHHGLLGRHDSLYALLIQSALRAQWEQQCIMAVFITRS
jgi:hypothetical protein